MRLIISGGGTGGHVYPALAVVQGLEQHCAEHNIRPQILWVGSQGGMEQALVERAGLNIKLISAAAIRGKNPISTVRSISTMVRGFWQSREIIARFNPNAVFVTGGYVCVPVTIAAYRLGVPVIIYLPDIEPGLAIKFLARYAACVAVTTRESQKFFRSGLTVVTGYPVRKELLETLQAESARKVAARQALGLDDSLPVLLVFGGSRGARSINRAVGPAVKHWLDVCQVIHVSGALDADWVAARRAELPATLQARYHTFAYLHQEMTSTLLAADLVVSRAGASVLGEFPAVGLPAVLVPYPYAGAHQTLNANYLVQHQAAVMVNDADLDKDLEEVVLDLLTNKEKLQAMHTASKQLAKPDASIRIAQEILEVGLYGN